MRTIQHDEHSLFVGMTGSGKTFLAEKYTKGVNKPLFVLDTKGTFVPWKDSILIRNLSQIKDALAVSDRVVYRPVASEMEMVWYDAFFKFCYDLKNCSILIDEVMQVCPNANSIPASLKGILTRGRELGVNLFSCTQRPATIPVVVLSESTHWFVFRMVAVSDRKKMVEISGYDTFMTKPSGHNFYYLDLTKDAPPALCEFRGGGVVKL